MSDFCQRKSFNHKLYIVQTRAHFVGINQRDLSRQSVRSQIYYAITSHSEQWTVDLWAPQTVYAVMAISIFSRLQN